MKEYKLLAAEKLHKKEIRRIARISRRWKITQSLRNLLHIKDIPMRKYWVFESTITSMHFSTYSVLDRTTASSFCAWVTQPVNRTGVPHNIPPSVLNRVYGPFACLYAANKFAYAKKAAQENNALRDWLRVTA